MMQSFRNAAKPVIVIISLTFIVWLVWDLSGLGNNSGGFMSRTSVGKINGQSVDVRVFDQAVQNAISEQQRQSGKSLSLDETAQVRNRVWDQFIQSILLQQEYQRRGLRVSTDEVADAISNVPPPEIAQSQEFQTNGQFDPDKYHRWLNSSVGQQVVPQLEAQYRSQILQNKLFRSVSSDVYISDPMLWQRYRDEKETVVIGLARIDPNTNVTAPAAQVSDAEAETYYKQHQDEFKRTKAAFLSYVSISRRPNAADSTAALERSRSIRDEIVKGTPFDEVAKRESADTISGRNGGDLGEMDKNQVDPAFGKAALSLPLKTVSEPVLSSFGYHIIQVESRQGDKFHAKHILIPIEVVGTHRDRLDKLADSLEQLGAEKPDPAALDTTARALHLTIKHVGPVQEGNRVVVPEEGVVPDVSIWAFQTKVGEQSQVIESPESFFLFRLDSLRAEGIPPFEKIKNEVKERIQLTKKKAEARRIGEGLAKQVRDGTPLAQAAKTLGVDYRQVGPFARLSAPLPSPVLIGAAFGLTKGEVSGPIETDDAVYLIQSIERTAADSADFAKNVAGIREQALQAGRRSRVQAYMTAMRTDAKIVDHRAEIYKSGRQASLNQ